MNTRTLDLYALHPESVPPEYATAELPDRNGRKLEKGGGVYLDQCGEPTVAFVAELKKGCALPLIVVRSHPFGVLRFGQSPARA